MQTNRFSQHKKAHCEPRNPAATTPEVAPRIPTLTPQYNPSTNSDPCQTTSHFLYRCSDSIMKSRQGLNQNKLCSLLPCRVSTLLNHFRWFMTPNRCSKTRPRFNSTGEKCKGAPEDCIYSRLLTAGGGWSQDILDVAVNAANQLLVSVYLRPSTHTREEFVWINLTSQKTLQLPAETQCRRV